MSQTTHPSLVLAAPVSASEDGQDDPSELGAQAYRRLKSDILKCVLAPGTVVTEQQAAERYGLGKGPIRSALLRLRHEGLVISERRKGYKVTEVTFADVKDVFQLRLLLEPEAARLAAGRLDEEDVRRLRAACEVEYDPNDPDSESAFLQSNKDFHVGVAAASGNARLAHLVSGLLDDVERILHLGLAQEPRAPGFQSEHREVLHLLMTNQGDAAAKAVYGQIQGGLSMVMKNFMPRPHHTD